MISLNTKDVTILRDGLCEQFNLWRKSDPSTIIELNNAEHDLVKLVDKNKLPDFWKLDNETQWDLMCALYCLYNSNVLELKPYGNSDITKVNKKVTGKPMSSTIETINLGWQDVD